jgi:hypothetical protein
MVSSNIEILISLYSYLIHLFCGKSPIIWIVCSSYTAILNRHYLRTHFADEAQVENSILWLQLAITVDCLVKILMKTKMSHSHPVITVWTSFNFRVKNVVLRLFPAGSISCRSLICAPNIRHLAGWLFNYLLNMSIFNPEANRFCFALILSSTFVDQTVCMKCCKNLFCMCCVVYEPVFPIRIWSDPVLFGRIRILVLTN